MNEQFKKIAAVLEAHRIEEESIFSLACTCGCHFFPNVTRGGATWHERHQAWELGVALETDFEWPWEAE